jgi:hypothetical protein
MGGYRRGFGLVNAYIDHLQIVTTSNYSAITNSQTLQFTTAHTKSTQFDVSSPVAAVASLASVFKSLLTGDCLTPRLAAISHQPLTLLTAVSRFS